MMRLVSKRLTKIINIPNMKDHGATGRHRVPEEHRLRQLLQRGAHASARQVAHLLRRRHAGRHRAAALENGAADHGRPARGLAWRPVREDDALRLLPATDHVRHRSGRHRSPAARHHRGQAPRGGRDLDLGPLAGVAEDRRHARAGRRSQRQHHHQGARAHRVRLDARPRRLRSRKDLRCRTSTV